MSGLVGILTRIATNSPWVQTLVKRIGLISMANRLLGWANIIRSVPGTSLKYRVRFCDTPVLANGIFKNGEYQMLASDVASIHTFIDLGCNVGLFPLYLCSISGRQDFRGIMVDGNPRVVAEAIANIQLNQLHEQITVVHGLAAANDGRMESEFCVTQNSLSSTAHINLLSSTNGISRITVPVVNVLAEFRKSCPESNRVDLLKLDIEGCELAFLATHQDLIFITDRIILEYHKRLATFDQVKDLLVPLGFLAIDRFDSPALPWGIAYFSR